LHVITRTLASFCVGLAILAGAATQARAQDAPIKVVVALLPFEVHSAGGLDYLETALVDLLESRLEASGKVDVVESVIVREAMVGYAAGQMAEDALRQMAQDVGADYVVTGSLTELAGQFSLDMRVTPVESAFTSKTMVFTANGEDELLDRVNELSERVVGIVTATPSALVSGVRLAGAEDLTGGLRSELETKPGQPYSSDAVRNDLERLRALPGIATATVETNRAATGVEVTFRLVTTDQLLAGPGTDDPTDVVAEVRIKGNRRIEADAILARISTREGTIYSLRRVASDIREVYSLGFFRNVRVLSEESLDGRVLIFEVEENPVIRQVTITGNDEIDGEKIRDSLTLTTGSTLDFPLLYENAQRIEGIYRAEGYYLANVSHEIETLTGNAVAIHFEVEEGKKLRLTEIRFEGNSAIDEAELRRGMRTKPWTWYSPVSRFLDKSGTYSEPVFQQDLRMVESKYADKGYVQVEVGEPKVDPLQEGLIVTVRVDEGDLFRVGKLKVTGDDTANIDRLKGRLALHEGSVFNRSFLTGDVEALTSHYTDRGFYFASIEPATDLSDTDKIIDVDFQVEKGPLYFVRKIDIEGNTTTIDPVIRREMQMVEGQLYSARSLRISEARIRSLGFFEEVNFEPTPTDYADQIDVDVNVVERPTGSLSFGAGFSSQDSFVVTASLSQTNLFGRGYGANLAVDWGQRSKRIFASFTDPYFLGTEFGLTGTVFFTSVEFESFDQEQFGIDLVLGHKLNLEGSQRGFLRYSFASRQVTEDSTASQASVIFRQTLSDVVTTSLVGLTLRGDTRNDRVAPTRGGQWAFSSGFAGLGGFSKFLRVEGRIQRFFRAPEWWPFFKDRSTFMLAARAGWSIPFNDVSDYDNPISTALVAPDGELQPLDNIDTDLTLPLSERYFLGGLGPFQLRGFRARSVGPRRSILRRSGFFGTGNEFTPVGRTVVIDSNNQLDAVCDDDFLFNGGNGNGKCNSLRDEDNDDFDDIEETDVIGGNKFISLTAEYRFPISDTLGLMGIVFYDTGNAFAENEQIWEIDKWRHGAGFGALWFSPFGPLQAFIGIPLDALEVEDKQTFEFSVGGANF
jgi:outer membrane protein insertion porin family